MNQNTKKLGSQFQFQDQDSSSTQSTCSYPEVASAGDSYPYDENKFSVQSGKLIYLLLLLSFLSI